MTEKTMGSIKDVVIETAKGLLDIGLMEQHAYDEIVGCFDEDSKVEELVCCNHEGKGSLVETLPLDSNSDMREYCSNEITIIPKQTPYIDVEERKAGAGRVETYVHSDLHTANKGGAMILVECETDFAARTDIFKGFAHECAKMFYAASHMHDCPTWEDVIEMFPDMIEVKADVETELGEKVAIKQTAVLIV